MNISQQSLPTAHRKSLADAMPLEIDRIRKLFPIFAKHPEMIFFDNASTTQKPETVIECISSFYTSACSNAGRASYRLSTQATNGIETSRNRVAKFIGAESSEIVFTSGATDSLNTVALSWGMNNLQNGDEVMVCLEDHQSAVLPWLNLKRILSRSGISISIVLFNVHDVGDYDLKSVREAVSARTRLIAMSHIHHVYGMDMEVSDIREIVGPEVLISLDASQSIGHIDVNAQKLNVDFISFSGHKIFTGNGTGILWINPRRHGQLAPIRLGGKSAELFRSNGDFEIPSEVSIQAMLENGTQNIPGILSFVPALDFIETARIDRIEQRFSQLTKYLYKGLKDLPGIDFAPGPGRCGCQEGYGIVSFRFEQVSSTDLSFLLDSEGIMVRAGDHCTSKKGEDSDYLRVSLHVYNTETEIDRFLAVLNNSVC